MEDQQWRFEGGKQQQICSTYCKYLTPKQQKKVILQLIKKEQHRQMVTGQWEPKRYLINQKWWTQWCDFVNFDSKTQLDNSYDINLLPKQKSNTSNINNTEAFNSRGWFDTQSNGGDGLSVSETESNDVSQ